MVKADPKHDYYADLELPSTADSESIKKQFKILAKRYHPDRNPGKEIECVPKFQAVQAAHEVLSDASQKKKYDSDRAKLNKPPDQPAPYPESYIYKRPQKPPPPPPSNFPPPPKRNGAHHPGQFGPGSARPTSSPSAEKFAQFAKAAPQQWDRAKFEDAARAETIRNLHNMRSPSQQPPRPPPRAPTAAKPGSTAPSPDIPPTSGPPPGFPGLSRTNSGRRAGFSPGTPGNDEPPASSTSAYAYTHRADRPPQPAGVYPPKAATPNSPSMHRPRPSMSPLRQSKSSGFEEAQRPGLSRSSSRYATAGGERTDVHSPGLTRSASVRNTANENRWGDSGPFGNRHQPQAHPPNGFKVPPPRHHSSSPNSRSKPKAFHLSASETSSSESEPVAPNSRPKATPRKTRPQQPSSTRSTAGNDPALTGQFPSNNYNKISEDKQYHYPPPDPSGTPYQRSFIDVTSPVDDITRGLNNAGIRHVHRDDVPVKKYEPPRSYPHCPKPWIGSTNAKVYNMNSFMINGVPTWILPSSVYPKKSSKDPCIGTPRTAKAHFNRSRNLQRDFTVSADQFVKPANTCTSQNLPQVNGDPSESDSAAPNTNTNATFSAADWNDKFSSNENIFRPNESTSANRSKSPPKQRGPKLPNRGRTMPRKENEREDDSSATDDIGAKMAGVRHVPGTTEGQSKAAAFQHGSFSAEDWAEKLRNHGDSNAPKGSSRPKAASKDPDRQPSLHDEVEVEEHPSPTNSHNQQIPRVNVEPDAMDVDESAPQGAPATGSGNPVRPLSTTSSRRPSSGGVNLNDLKDTAPFKPAASGLGNFDDLNQTLPFESRAASELNLHQPPSAGPAARHLNLPKPPKPILPPDEMHLSQENWSKYSERMVRYMHDWNVFNCKMIDHFRTRQEQITLSMYHNWVTAVGDGASADDFDGLDFVGESDNVSADQADGNNSSPHKPKKAGYATYMQWLEQDRVCRTWWDVAFDEHTACMEDLGRIRRVVKAIRAREFGKHG